MPAEVPPGAEGLSPHPFQMQYVFIYQALLEHYLYGDTELEVTSLEIHLQKIYNKVPGTSSNGLEEEFKVSLVPALACSARAGQEGASCARFSSGGPKKLSLLSFLPLQKLTSIKIQNDKMRTGNLPANMKKNRVLQIIPCKAGLGQRGGGQRRLWGHRAAEVGGGLGRDSMKGQGQGEVGFQEPGTLLPAPVPPNQGMAGGRTKSSCPKRAEGSLPTSSCASFRAR